MAKERNPLSYLSDDWSGKPPGGDNASGVTETPDYDLAVPGRADMPEHEEWGLGPDGRNDYGHSKDCTETTDMKAWGVSQADVERGYSKPDSDGEGGVLETRQPGGSFEQSIPDKNPHDRQQAYAREHSDTTGVHDGKGRPESTSNPGGETIGSSKLPY
jgi:hypothetical protein